MNCFCKPPKPIKPLWIFHTYYGTDGKIVDFGYEEDSLSTGDVKSISADQTPTVFVEPIPDWVEIDPDIIEGESCPERKK